MAKNYISVDLGTENTLIYSAITRDIVYNQPSIMAYNTKTKRLVSLGNDAHSLIGKEHRNISLIRPITDGVIGDLNATKEMLKLVFSKIKLLKALKNSIVLLAAPSSVTELEYNSLREMAKKLGAKEVYIEEEIKMAAVGAGINIMKPEGNLVVDIGGGTTDVAVIASGDIVISRSIKSAGRQMTNEIQKYLREKHNIVVGEKTAEILKKNLGTLEKNPDEAFASVFGSDVLTGTPKETRVTNSEIREIITPVFENITDLIIEVLGKTKPELVGDIFRNNSIYFCGGGALIPGIRSFFLNVLKIPVTIANNPLLCVIQGTIAWETYIQEEIQYQRVR